MMRLSHFVTHMVTNVTHSLVLVEHAAELRVVYPPRAVLVKLLEGGLHLLLAEVGTDFLELAPAYKSVAVRVQSFERKFDSGMMPYKFFIAHLAIQVPVSVSEYVHNVGSGRDNGMF